MLAGASARHHEQTSCAAKLHHLNALHRSIMDRTFLPSASGAKGFVSMSMPASRKSPRTAAFSAYPVTKSTFRSGRERLPSGEGEQAMRQRSGSLSGDRCRIHESRYLLGTVRGHAPSNDVERADDAGQEVVEIVGDAASELADRLHFLGLPQGLLRVG
jgi:hypothetical protein